MYSRSSILLRGCRHDVLSRLSDHGATVVYRVFDGNEMFVVKRTTIRSPLISNASDDEAINEAKVLRSYSSDFIIRLHFYACVPSLGGELLYLKLEDGGENLQTILRSAFQRTRALNGSVIRFYCLGVLQCLHALHGFGIVHLGMIWVLLCLCYLYFPCVDIKPANFVLRLHLKVIDLGLSRVLPTGCRGIKPLNARLTPSYSSPERFAECLTRHCQSIIVPGVLLPYAVQGEPCPFPSPYPTLV